MKVLDANKTTLSRKKRAPVNKLTQSGIWQKTAKKTTIGKFSSMTFCEQKTLSRIFNHESGANILMSSFGLPSNDISFWNVAFDADNSYFILSEHHRSFCLFDIKTCRLMN